MLDVYENREKQKVYPLCIDTKTKNGHSVKTFAHEFFGEVPYIGKLIESCPVLFDSHPWNRKTKAIKDGFVLKSDFTTENEIILIDKIKLKQMLRENVYLIPKFKEYLRSFYLKTCGTVSKETNHETLNMIKELCEEVSIIVQLYEGDIVGSIRSNCLFGFIPQNELFEIIKKENPAYLLEKNKANKYTFADGKLMITLW